MQMWHKLQPGLVTLYLEKPKSGSTRVENVDHMPLWQTGML